jgi:hypothetical protein
MHALTALTPLPFRHALILRLAFAKTKLLPGSEVTGLAELAFVHFARWTFLPLPREARRRRGDRCLLFESNFNGSFAEYLDAFATQLKQHMRRIWKGCYGGPDMASTTIFREYARRHESAAEYYYCPYATATVREINAALSLADRVERLVSRAASSVEAERLRAGVEELLAGLGRTRPAGGAGRDPLAALLALPATLAARMRTLLRPAQAGGVSAVTVWAPIAAGRLDALREDIEALRRAEAPIGLEGRTHFARWVSSTGSRTTASREIR